MVVATNVRAPHEGVLLAAFQTAKSIAVTDFTTSDAERLWTDKLDFDVGPEAHGDVWQDTELGPPSSGSYHGRAKPTGTATVKLTAASAEWLLRSNFGAFAAGSFTLGTQVAATQWLTLAWVEDRHLGTSSSKRLVRIADTWVHQLDIVVPEGPGIVTLEAQFAARATADQALSAGGITLPSTPMRPSDDSVCSTAQVTLVRDPASANVAQRIYSARITLNQGLAHEYDQATLLYDVWKTGKLQAEIEMELPVADESFTFLTRALAGSSDRYQMAFAVGSSTLTVDLYDVRLRVEPLGHDGRNQPRLKASGVARVSALGNLVTISLA